jgi:hypothetical protein
MSLFCLIPSQSTTPLELHPPPSFHAHRPSAQRHPRWWTSRPSFICRTTYQHVNSCKKIFWNFIVSRGVINYTSPRAIDPLVHHLDQVTEARACPLMWPIPASRPHDHAPCDRFPRTAVWVGAGLPRVDPTPRGPSRIPIEPTRPWPSRRPRMATTSRNSVIFRGSLSHVDKALAIFEFSVDHCYSAQLIFF